jgi:hypothetical protein
MTATGWYFDSAKILLADVKIFGPLTALSAANATAS